MLEVELASPVGVGGNAQVGRVPQIHTELELVVAHKFGPVVGKLLALLFFNQGTVATGDIEGLAKLHVQPVEKEPWQPVGGNVRSIQARQT